MGVCLIAILVQQKNSNIEALYVILKGKQSHHSTNCSITNLISEIGKDPVFSSVYCRNLIKRTFIVYLRNLLI